MATLCAVMLPKEFQALLDAARSLHTLHGTVNGSYRTLVQKPSAKHKRPPSANHERTFATLPCPAHLAEGFAVVPELQRVHLVEELPVVRHLRDFVLALPHRVIPLSEFTSRRVVIKKTLYYGPDS